MIEWHPGSEGNKEVIIHRGDVVQKTATGQEVIGSAESRTNKASRQTTLTIIYTAGDLLGWTLVYEDGEISSATYNDNKGHKTHYQKGKGKDVWEVTENGKTKKEILNPPPPALVAPEPGNSKPPR